MPESDKCELPPQTLLDALAHVSQYLYHVNTRTCFDHSALVCVGMLIDGFMQEQVSDHKNDEQTGEKRKLKPSRKQFSYKEELRAMKRWKQYRKLPPLKPEMESDSKTSSDSDAF